jgi:hypothetical protein
MLPSLDSFEASTLLGFDEEEAARWGTVDQLHAFQIDSDFRYPKTVVLSTRKHSEK